MACGTLVWGVRVCNARGLLHYLWDGGIVKCAKLRVVRRARCVVRGAVERCTVPGVRPTTGMRTRDEQSRLWCLVCACAMGDARVAASEGGCKCMCVVRA